MDDKQPPHLTLVHPSIPEQQCGISTDITPRPTGLASIGPGWNPIGDIALRVCAQVHEQMEARDEKL